MDKNTRRDFVKTGALFAGAALCPVNATLSKESKTPAGTYFDVKLFGASGDGKTIDTPAINRAIETAAAAGGGTVVFPAGTYLCFSIRLKSKIALYIDAGATIVAAEPQAGKSGYDPPEPNAWDKYQDFGHSHWHNS